mmetsp:Transcript_37306/g.90647  ORF Transcript_37306/g.90647 Transcript_37306/m.90647 type:complete len:208 (-) Transcript_37306:1242-1865(-)
MLPAATAPPEALNILSLVTRRFSSASRVTYLGVGGIQKPGIDSCLRIMSLRLRASASCVLILASKASLADASPPRPFNSASSVRACATCLPSSAILFLFSIRPLISHGTASAANLPPAPLSLSMAISAWTFASFRSRSATSLPASSSTTTAALLLTVLILLPNSREQKVSSECSSSLETLMTTLEHDFPPKALLNSMVRVDSRQGTC